MLEINQNQSTSSNYVLRFNEGIERADEILQYFGLPQNRSLEFYDHKGNQFFTYRYEGGSYANTDPISQDRSKEGTLSLIWDSPNAIIAFANAKPLLFEFIESQQKLKPDRISHPLDGAIHSIQMTWQPNQNPQVTVVYTSGVMSSDGIPALEEGDVVYDGYLTIFSTLHFEAPEFAHPAF